MPEFLPHGLKLLLVEDNPGDVDLIREHMADASASPPVLEVAETLSDAFVLLDEHDFDAVLLDLNLPDSAGLETLERVLAEFPQMPVTVLTGIGSGELGLEAVKRGAAEFIPKDEITGRLLLRSLRFALERQRRRQTEDRFRALIEHSWDLISILDADFSIRYVSPSLSRILGFEPEEKVGDAAMMEVHPDDRARVEEEARRLLENPSYRARFVYRVRHRDGGWRAFETIAQNRLDDPAIQGLLLNSWDVTELRRARQQTERTARTFRKTVSAISDATLIIGREDHFRRIQYVNPATERIFGYSREELVGETTEKLHVDREQYERFGEMGQRALRREGTYRGTFSMKRKDGSVFEAEQTVSLLNPDSGLDGGAVSVVRDISEQVEAHRKLERTEEYYRALMQESGDVVLVLEADMTVRQASTAVEDLLGLEPSEVRGRNGLAFVHPDDRNRVARRLEEIVSSSEGPMRESFRTVRADGDVRHVEAIARNLLDVPAVGGLVVNIRDVTEQNVLEKQLRQAQKMEAVGRLAGGIAHDFNNLLTVVRAHSDFLHMEMAASDPLVEELDAIRDAADRAATLTNQLLAFSRDQVLRPRIVDPNGILHSMKRLVTRVLGEDIRIETKLDDDVRPIRVDPGQLEQALLNLAVNARDAMPEGGTLTFTTGNEEIDADENGDAGDLEPGSYVRLSVADTGVGMDAEAREKIYEPFFTTKDRTGGTGLGLAMVYGFVTQSDGSIEVESAPGEGATFTLRFPAVDAEPDAVEEAGVEPMDATELGGRILVIEDDDSVRRVTRMILRRAGLEVEERENAESGLELLEAGEEEFDAVLTDLVLPGMGGRKLIDRLRRHRPELPLIAMSGYAEGSPGRRGDLAPEVYFVQKPFSPDGLLEVVRKALAKE